MKNSNDCIILGCGPSLEKLDKDKLKGLSATHNIFAIKQAYNFLPEVVDYHFINDNNYSVYDYSKSDCKVVAEFPLNHFVTSIANTADIIYKVDNSDFNKSLSVTHAFEKNTIAKSEVRPWGPGIIYEVVFFFAYHLGMKSIKTVGWDLGPPGDRTRNHFYNHEVMSKAFPMTQRESDQEVELTLGFYKWLKSKGVELTICSESYAHKDIPRDIL